MHIYLMYIPTRMHTQTYMYTLTPTNTPHTHTHTHIHTPLQSSQPDPLELQRQQESRRRAVARRRAREQLRPRSPEAVDGRRHVDVQTELYLEEITDRVEEADVCIQTDAFLDRPPTPLFVPAKTGVDVSTQIEEGDVSVCLSICPSVCMPVCWFLA